MNALGIIVHPIEERRIGPFRLQGLFIGRQPEAAAEYAETTSDEIVTIANVAGNPMHGTQADRTRTMICNARRPDGDGAAGLSGPTVRLANETVSRTPKPARTPTLVGGRSGELGTLTTDRLRARSPAGSSTGRREIPEVAAV